MGSTSATLTIATTGDATDENDETFTVTLSSPSANAKLGSAQTATGTIVDDDGTPTVSIEDAEAEEGAGVEFTVNLSHASSGAVTVQYTTSDATATAGSTDYTAASGRTLTLGTGETSATLTIATTEDTDDEEDETFTVTLATPSSNAALGARRTATGTIVDDDLSADATLSALALTDTHDNLIDLTPATFDPATLAYTASVASGVTAVTVTPELGDGNAAVAYVPSVDSDLTSDGHQVALSVGATAIEVTVTAEDGNSTRTYTVTVTRALGQVTGESLTPGAGRLTVGWNAVTGADGYKVQWRSGGETFAAASAEGREAVIGSGATTTHLLTGLANATAYTVRVMATKAGLADGPASGEITAFTPALPALTIEDATATEGSAVAFTVELDAPSSSEVTVEYSATVEAGDTATLDASAPGGADFTAASGTLTVTAGSTTGTVSIATAGDTTHEDDETFTVTLSSPSSNAELGTPNVATGTIEDDEGTPTLTIEPAATAEEGDDVEFTVTLSPASSGEVTVRYTTSGGTATSGTDYTAAANRTLTLGAGSTSATLTIATTPDTTAEDDETFTVTLSSPSSNAELGAAKTATGTIEDDDGTPTLTIESAATAAEGNAVEFTVTLSPASSGEVTVRYTTSDGTATAGTDYTAAVNRTLTLGAGSTSATLTIATTPDTTAEDDETFTVTLSSPSSNAELGAAKTATGTIEDDDGTPTLTIESAATAAEGDDVEFTVTLSHASSSAVTVRYTTSDGTASSSDYTAAANRTLSITAGATSATLTIATTEDTTAEDDETFTVTLSSPSSNAALGTPKTATGTIEDDDVTAEPLSTNATLRGLVLYYGTDAITLTPAFSAQVTSYTASVANVVAKVTVAPTAEDPDAALAHAPSVDSDLMSAGHQVALSVGANTIEVEVTAEDGNSTRTYTVTVTRALGRVAGVALTPGAGQLKVDWTAVTGADGYRVQWRSGGETFADAADDDREAVVGSGTTTTRTITGLANETAYTVRVKATKAGLEDGPASAEMTETPALPALTIEDATATEGAGVAFTVTLSRAAAGAVTVQYTTSDETGDGGAEAGTDYTAASGRTLTLGAGFDAGHVHDSDDAGHDGRERRDVHGDAVESVDECEARECEDGDGDHRRRRRHADGEHRGRRGRGGRGRRVHGESEPCELECGHGAVHDLERDGDGRDGLHGGERPDADPRDGLDERDADHRHHRGHRRRARRDVHGDAHERLVERGARGAQDRDGDHRRRRPFGRRDAERACADRHPRQPD